MILELLNKLQHFMAILDFERYTNDFYRFTYKLYMFVVFQK